MEAPTNPETLTKYVRVFEDAEIPYLVVGAFAVMAHGFPRFSSDLDIVLQFPFERRDEIVALVREMGGSSFEERIDPEWGRRVACRIPEGITLEVFFVPSTELHDREFSRAVTKDIAGHLVRFISPEDLVLRKLVNTRLRRGEDYDDAVGVALRMAGELDRDYLRNHCAPHRICKLLEALFKDADSEDNLRA